MSDIVDLLQKQRERIALLKKQAEEAAREAGEEHARARRWEHCEPPDWEPVGLVYPWNIRPIDLPVSEWELDLALKTTNNDIVLAARCLRVNLDRLEVAVHKFPKYKHLVKRFKNKPDSKVDISPVSARREGERLIVTIRKAKGPHELQVGFDEEDNLVIVVEPELTKLQRDVLKRALEVFEEGKKND
jgi:hypothetical protein